MTIEVSEREARLLALLLKRLTWDDVDRRAEDGVQREDMLLSVESVRQNIERALSDITGARTEGGGE
jgi:hypothetical protein